MIETDLSAGLEGFYWLEHMHETDIMNFCSSMAGWPLGCALYQAVCTEWNGRHVWWTHLPGKIRLLQRTHAILSLWQPRWMQFCPSSGVSKLVQPVFALPRDFDGGTHAIRVSREVMQQARSSPVQVRLYVRKELRMPVSVLLLIILIWMGKAWFISTPNFLSFKGVLSSLPRFLRGYSHPPFINLEGITAFSKLLNIRKTWV